MKNIVELLREKNQCLEKFYRLNDSELANFASGKFDHLEVFYGTREGLLEIIRKVDELIESSNDEAVFEDVEVQMKASIEEELDYKNELVSRILEQDLKILAAIESEKSNIIKELCQVKAARKAVSSYKSGRTENNLDEEA